MTIQEYFGDWSKVINLSEAENLVKKLSHSGKSVCPAIKDIYKAFRLCSLKNTRVVILAQDPYPQKGIATGIALANDIKTKRCGLSPSLEILKESVIDYSIPHGNVIFDASLEKWEEQGVLMLNSALSCELGKPNSHTLLWVPFITDFLTNMSKHTTGIVYILMGSQAGGFEFCINKKFNHVIKCSHPSYYARTKEKMPSDIWRKVNDILISQNGYGIEWFEETTNSN